MRIGKLAKRLGVTRHAIRFYEGRGLLPAPERSENRYREYTEQAAELATMCAAGRCDEVSGELQTLLADKRIELARRMDEMRFLDQRMRHLAGELDRGASPRRVIGLRKEDQHATAV